MVVLRNHRTIECRLCQGPLTLLQQFSIWFYGIMEGDPGSWVQGLIGRRCQWLSR